MKMLNVIALRPLKHYLPKDLMNPGRRLRAKYHEGHTFAIADRLVYHVNNKRMFP